MVSFCIKKGRAPALLLALLLLVTLLPTRAFAAEPLTLLRAEVTSDGGVGLTFSKELSTTDLANKIKASFAVTGLDGPISITNATLHSASGGYYNFIQLYLSQAIRGGEAAALSYTPGDVQAADGGTLASIASMDIVNNLLHPTLNTTNPGTATVGTVYSHTFTAADGTAPYTFSLDSEGGNLPDGLTLNANGTVSGTPIRAGTFQFAVLVEDVNLAFDLRPFSITVQEAPVNVCEIGGAGYTSLGAALAAIPGGGTATIRLLRSIDHSAAVFIEGKAVTFDLNGFTLNINNPAPGGVGLAVQQGGSVNLAGSGALNATGETYGVRVSTNVLATHATVTSATATGPAGEAAYAAGTNASLTVLGNVTATGVSAMGAHTISNAEIDIRGSVFASNQGVYASGSTIHVAGDVQANGLNILNEPIGIGVGVYAGSVTVGGSVRANRVGVMVRANGTTTVDGTITAPGYIQFADDAPVEISDFLMQTTKAGYRTYQTAAGTVWVKGESIPTEYPITVQTDGNGIASANTQSAAEGAEITLSATPNNGYRFKEWQVISGGVSISNNKFYVLDQNIIIQALFEPIPTYSVSVVGSYASTTGAGNHAEGSAVSIYAGDRSNYTFTGWSSSDVTITNASSKNASFTMPGKAVTVTANWDYNGNDNSDGGSGGGGSSKTVYTVINGVDGTWQKGSASGLTFTCAGSYSRFSGVWVDGTAIAADNYTAVSGSTVLTLKPTYLKALADGRHILRIIYSDGYAQTTFTVKAGGLTNPQTGVEFDFKDVQESDWFYEDAAYVFENGLMNGTGAAVFSPNMPTTRGMIVTVLYRLEGSPAETGSNPFSDTESGSYCEKAAIWAAASGIFNGYGNGKFGPGDSITREQLATILYRYAVFKGYDVRAAATLGQFTDADKVDAWAADAMVWAKSSGIINGTSATTLDPTGTVTRAQLAAMLRRFCEAHK